MFIEQNITHKLFSVFGDVENQKIINALKYPHTAYKAHTKTGIPRSTFYRKLSIISKTGVIFLTGFKINQTGPIKIYESLFNNIEFKMQESEIFVRASLLDKTYNQSNIISRLTI